MIQNFFQKNSRSMASGDWRMRRQKYVEWFHDLGAKPEELDNFQLHWDQIRKSSLNPEQLVDVLKCAEAALSEHESLPAAEAAKKYLTDHIGSWTKSALPILSTFYNSQLAESLWVFGQLRVYPGDQFMKAWKNRAMHNDIVWEDRHARMLVSAQENLGISLPRAIRMRKLPPMVTCYLRN